MSIKTGNLKKVFNDKDSSKKVKINTIKSKKEEYKFLNKSLKENKRIIKNSNDRGRISCKNIHKYKIGKKVKVNTIKSKKEEYKFLNKSLKGNRTRINKLKSKAKNVIINNLKSSNGTIDSTSNAIYEVKKQADSLKDIGSTVKKVIKLRRKENRNFKKIKDIVLSIKKPYIHSEVNEDTKDTAIISIRESKEKVRIIKDTYNFIRPNKKDVIKSQKIRTQVNKKSKKIYSQVKEKNIIHFKKENNSDEIFNFDKSFKNLDIKLNKSKNLYKENNNISASNRFSSKQKLRTRNFQSNQSNNGIMKNSKSIWKEKRKVNIKQKLYRKLKSNVNSVKKIINFLKSPSKFICFGGVGLGVFILIIIMNIFFSSAGAVTTTVPNIKNPDEWITNMNKIDSAENTKINAGEYFVLKNHNIKIDWKNVIAVVMAKNENYLNDNNTDNNLNMSENKTIITGTYSEIINEVGTKYNVDPALISAIITQESNFDKNCLSSAGAMGLMQLMPENCQEYGVLNPYDPYQNIIGGTREISDLLKKYNGNLTLALAGYNAGIGNVQKYNGVPPFKETQDYVVKVTAYYNAYRNGKSLPNDIITGNLNCIGNDDLSNIYQLFNETNSSKDENGNTIITLIKHDIEYVMKKLNFTDNQKEIARATVEANMFSEVFKNFNFKFKYNIPKGAENGQVVSLGINNLNGVVIETKNKKRKDIIDTALKIVGKVKYFWGGKSHKGWNNAWGKDTLVTATGSKTTGTIRPYGLDCSGFVGWLYDTANISDMLQNGGTSYQYANSTAISFNEVKAGDLAFNNDISHIGIYVGKKNGKNIFIECSSSKGVTVSSWNGFTQFRKVNIDLGGEN